MHTLVRIVPMLGTGDIGLLSIKAMILFLPSKEFLGEGFFICSGQCECKRTKFFPSFALRSSGEILGHYLQLMKVTHLYRYILKHRSQATSSVYHCGSERPSTFFKYLSSILVVNHLLTGDFVPPEVTSQCPRSKDCHTILSSPEGRVRDYDGSLGYEVCGCLYLMLVKILSNGDMTLLVLLS